MQAQTFNDRRFYRSKIKAEQALAEFAALARSEVGLDRLILELALITQVTMQP